MYTLCFILLICISVLTCRLVRLYVSTDIQEVTPSTLRGFEHSTATRRRLLCFKGTKIPAGKDHVGTGVPKVSESIQFCAFWYLV